MASKKKDKIKQMRQLRDAKVRQHLQQYAPVWMVEDTPVLEDDVLRFNVVFYHPRYGWVNRRYRYDAFNDVLYYNGQRQVSEEDAVALEDHEPYITAEVVNTVNAYGG